MEFFDYSNAPAAEWAAHLSELSRDPSTPGVLIHVFWGDHEALQGVRDFHSKSRLKLEKLCSLAFSLQIPLHVRFGFTHEARSFPAWTHELSPRALVPARTEKELINPWEFSKVPSFRNDSVRRSFLEFLAEALSLLSLYRAPEGSVHSVSFDWGTLQADSHSLDPLFIESELSQRYQSVEKLNSIFQTHFNSFQPLSKPAGLKTLLNKRPWIACWDYKLLKKKAFKIWEEEIKSVFLNSKFSWNGLSPILPLSHETNCILFDDTLLEASMDADWFSPLIIQGELDSNILRAFRVAEMLQLDAAAHGERVLALSSWIPSPENRLCLVVSSKFMSRQAHFQLTRVIQSGGKVVFPLGAPKWDENMDSLFWDGGSIGQLSLELDEKLYEKMRECFL